MKCGSELIRRTKGGEAFALTCPLITKADGGKFGKTESGNIWLDPRYTSPYKFYQFWLNVSDEDAAKYIKIFTSLSKEEIESLIAEHTEAPHLRVLQKRLAKPSLRFALCIHTHHCSNFSPTCDVEPPPENSLRLTSFSQSTSRSSIALRVSTIPFALLSNR